MTNQKKIVWLITLIFFILVFISIYLVIYVFDFRGVITPYSQNTYVSNIYIGGKTSSQVEEEITKRINEWKEDFYIELSFQNRSYIINIEDSQIFDFNIEKTIQEIENGKISNYEKGINVIKVDFKKENQLEEILSDHYDELKFSDFNVDVVKTELLKRVSFLYKEIYLDLGMALDLEKAKVNKVGKEIHINSGINNNLNKLVAEYFTHPIEIKGKSHFSLNEYLINSYNTYLENFSIPNISITDYEQIFNYFFTNDELNRIATGVYQTILPTNFVNINKSISKTLPSYARENINIDTGMALIIREAAIDIKYDYIIEEINNEHFITNIKFSGEKDLSFYNPNYHSYYLKIDYRDDNLVFQLYGPSFIYDYKILFTTKSYHGGYESRLVRVTYYKGKELNRQVLAEDYYM